MLAFGANDPYDDTGYTPFVGSEGGGGVDWLSVGSTVLKALPGLGGLAGGKSGPTTTTSSASSALSANNAIETVFDNSGWVVTFGQNSGVSTDRTQTETRSIDQTARAESAATATPSVTSSESAGSSWFPYVALLFGAVILFRMVKR